MTEYHIVQIIDTAFLQNTVYQVRVCGITPVNHHVVAITGYEGGVSLAYIEEHDLQTSLRWRYGLVAGEQRQTKQYRKDT
jgi:hypothetical protein